jgi:hypothetical protein
MEKGIIMEYIEVKDEIIIAHYCAKNKPKGTQFISTINFTGNVGMNLNMIDIEKGGQFKPLEQLISEKLITDNRGKYYDINDKSSHEINELNVDPGEEWTSKQPKTSYTYEVFNKTLGKWEIDEVLKNEVEVLEPMRIKLEIVKVELRSTDYKVIKACEYGKTVDELYPNESKIRQDLRNEINVLRELLIKGE